LLTRSIEFYPGGLTTTDRIFRNGRHLCIAFAVGAMSLGVLDLANIRSGVNAATLIRDGNLLVADIPNQLRAGIERISFTSAEPSAIAMIPSDGFAAATKSQNAAVASLAAAGRQDAVQFAMASRPSFAGAARPASAPLPTEPFKLASADANSLPEAVGPSLSRPMANSLMLAMVPMPRPAPGVPPPSPAQRLHLEGKEYAKAQRCLANAIYFEARSEPVRGQMAVAQVVVNRAFSGFYPNDICGVVYQNAGHHLACQFTFACDGKSKMITERGHWARANRIAKETLDGQIYVPEVAKSTHYHAIYVHPNWVGEMKKMVRYGLHNFYRPYAWGNGADEPVWGLAAMAQAKGTASPDKSASAQDRNK